ncbi:hypothetical protein XVE_4077 [Xanthomonas vesicatoria ATCC 35937]|uniref:Uncharacterized protein n=1 Tax=Xanthomonas vesicatoria ATCC 35937 TaxID=925775 RepID=F0BIH4_9XANT|nr:hypothetical protein XVE_4077 [Xanthomonas vesicatoria ATCC 35937]
MLAKRHEGQSPIGHVGRSIQPRHQPHAGTGAHQAAQGAHIIAMGQSLHVDVLALVQHLGVLAHDQRRGRQQQPVFQRLAQL